MSAAARARCAGLVGDCLDEMRETTSLIPVAEASRSLNRSRRQQLRHAVRPKPFRDQRRESQCSTSATTSSALAHIGERRCLRSPICNACTATTRPSPNSCATAGRRSGQRPAPVGARGDPAPDQQSCDPPRGRRRDDSRLRTPRGDGPHQAEPATNRAPTEQAAVRHPQRLCATTQKLPRFSPRRTPIWSIRIRVGGAALTRCRLGVGSGQFGSEVGGDEDDLVFLAADQLLLAALHQHVGAADAVLLGGTERVLARSWSTRPA